jgi:glycosyltransferase involved in cell wall biosynthesis
MIRNILFLHQSADLYGSDKVLLAIVRRLGAMNFNPIVVVPVAGPLVRELRLAGVECHVAPLTRLSRSMLTLRGLIGLPGDLMRSFRALDQLLQGRPVAALHSNTLAVLTGAFWARRHGVAHVWHVHEIITHPRFVKAIYGYLLKWFSDRIICVSHATQKNLVDDQPSLNGRCRMIWNGFSDIAAVDVEAVADYRRSLAVQDGEILLTLVGRINRLKGQKLLVAAAGRLWERGVRNFRVLIVGSVVPGQEHFLHALEQAVATSPIASRISVRPFTNEILTVWASCDVAVIPSTEPESFGMVALEAMAVSKPVVAADLGGLAEIVVPGQTGWLVPPGNADALADALEQAITRPDLRLTMGLAGQARCRAEFTLDRQVKQMAAVYEELIR